MPPHLMGRTLQPHVPSHIKKFYNNPSPAHGVGKRLLSAAAQAIKPALHFAFTYWFSLALLEELPKAQHMISSYSRWLHWEVLQE